MNILRHGKFISGSRIYRAGDVLPDSAGAQELVKRRLAETIEDTSGKKSKPPKKSEPANTTPTSENVAGNP